MQWHGLPDEADWTWEPVVQLHKDVPALVMDFFESPGKKRIEKKAQNVLVQTQP